MRPSSLPLRETFDRRVPSEHAQAVTDVSGEGLEACARLESSFSRGCWQKMRRRGLCPRLAKNGNDETGFCAKETRTTKMKSPLSKEKNSQKEHSDQLTGSAQTTNPYAIIRRVGNATIKTEEDDGSIQSLAAPWAESLPDVASKSSERSPEGACSSTAAAASPGAVPSGHRRTCKSEGKSSR